MWFSSFTGLIKFDGYNFTSFNFDLNKKNSLPDKSAVHLCEDSAGNIWVSHDAFSILSKYNPHTENFTVYRSEDNNKCAAPSGYISSLVADKTGRLWVGTDRGLSFYEAATNRFIDLSDVIFPDTLSSREIKCLMIDHGGLLWIGTGNGINIYDAVHKKLKLFNPPDKNYVFSKKEVSHIMQDHSGNIWISLELTGLGNRGIYRYNPSTNFSKMYYHSAVDPGSLSAGPVNALIEDSHHTIWACMYAGGLCAYEPETDNFKTYRADANNRYALNSDQITSLFEDRSGVFWIGANGGGLNNCYLTNKRFAVYQNYDKEFISHFPLSLYKDHSGKVYMGTFGVGIHEFDPVKGRVRSFKFGLPNDEITGFNFCYGMLEASDGNFWLVTFDEGLHKLDRKSGRFTTVHSTGNNKDTAFHNQSNCIVEDGNKRLWIGTNNGLKCYDLKSRIFSGFENLYPDTNQLSNDEIVNLYCDPEGMLWIAGTNGLTLFDTKTGRIKIFKHDDNNPHSLSINHLNYVYDDGKGKVWLGTEGGGLNEFDKRTEQFTSYMLEDGLPDNSVSGILEDEFGNLWLSTNKGICKFSPPSGENKKAVCRNYNISDGLPGDEYYYNTCVKGDDGTLYFASTGGLVAFKPNELEDNQFIPPVVITDFSVFNKSVEPNDSTGILNLPADETKEIKLSYRQNIFSFTFSALSYIHPEKNRYAYMLEGFDKDWIYTDASRRFANYTNLGAGEYTFRVKASNNDGVWNEKGASIKLIITPPYWQRWWFRLLMIIAVASVAYGIYSYRMREVIRLQNIRNKISGDLHDDIGSTLNSISIYSEVAKQDASKHAHALEMIGEASRKIIDAMSDIVWTINPENDSFENIILRMRSLAFNLLRAKNIEFIFKADEGLDNIKLSLENRRNLFLIFKEAINNLIKYADASKVSIQLLREGSLVKLVISDNGKGFDTTQRSTGNGLNSMKRRAGEMKAQLQIESVIEEGTRIDLTLRS